MTTWPKNISTNVHAIGSTYMKPNAYKVNKEFETIQTCMYEVVQ